jgi:hypothetical protein
VPESMDFRAWLDQTEREAHDAIARSYAEGCASLGSRPDTEREPNREGSTSPSATAFDDAPVHGDRGQEQPVAAPSTVGDQHS